MVFMYEKRKLNKEVNRKVGRSYLLDLFLIFACRIPLNMVD